MFQFRASGSLILTIPDGDPIDFSLPENPGLNFTINELSSHDLYEHIYTKILELE